MVLYFLKLSLLCTLSIQHYEFTSQVLMHCLSVDLYIHGENYCYCHAYIHLRHSEHSSLLWLYLFLLSSDIH